MTDMKVPSGLTGNKNRFNVIVRLFKLICILNK